MQRNRQEGNVERSNKDNIVDKLCDVCGNGRMWTSRGLEAPSYVYKCTKCGHVIR